MVLYKFIRYNTESLYGYGTSSDALRYLQWLDRHRGGNWYTQKICTSPREAERISFNMSDELAAIDWEDD